MLKRLKSLFLENQNVLIPLSLLFTIICTLIIINCARQVSPPLNLESKMDSDFILDSYLFPDSISLYFNTGYDLNLDPREGILTEMVDHKADTLEYILHDFAEQGTRSILILQDCSGSMIPYIRKVSQTIKSFIAYTPPQDEIRIIRFGGNIQSTKSFTNDKALLYEWLSLQQMPQPHGTPLFEALQTGIDYLGSELNSKFLVLFTDGNVSSTENYESLIRWAREVNIRIFVVGFGTQHPGLLSELAKNTTGIFFMDNGHSYQHIAGSLFNWVTKFYRLTYSPKYQALDGQEHFIRFSVPLTPIQIDTMYRVPLENIYIFSSLSDVNKSEYPKSANHFYLPEALSETIIIPFFDMGNVILLPSAKKRLDQFIENLNLISSEYAVKIFIEGFTCDVGSADYNLQLSGERAISVDDYLSPKLPNNIKTELHWYGESQPINNNTNSTERALNRRVTIRILQQYKQSAIRYD